ncbi:MAG: UDP-3-O-(3-hydroxymyristoyl)glucosamine N-acyltransferase [Gammaproteobacteria bacterium]|nr:MAG: UDP-3-O-(3-hydroxymyristoyl)glucosamine N-acyltransferase [Gammaproteobacteria bacterium]
MKYSLSKLIAEAGGSIAGDEEYEIDGVAPLIRAERNQLAFLSNTKYLSLLSETHAGCVVMLPENGKYFSGNKILSDNPHLTYARIAALIHPYRSVLSQIDGTAIINVGAKLHENITVGPGVYIGDHVEIGEGTVIEANAVIFDNSVIGKRCIVHAGAVVGSEGFGFAKDGSKWIKVPQLGRVVLGDDVEIGSNSTIDRGALDDTIIHDGVKIDNLVQIAHNVEIGEDSILAGCVGVAGSATIGKRCSFGGQAGVSDHVEIVDDVQVAARSVVVKSIKKPGTYSSCMKSDEISVWQRKMVRLNQLNDMAKRLITLEKALRNLKGEK